MIDEAETINSRRRNDGIGLISRGDEDGNESDDGPSLSVYD